MFLRELFEAKARKVVAVMPGGFHPFHPGHKSLYDWAVKTFGQNNVYVAATNDTKARPFPFEVKKKLAAMAGVPESNFMQVKSPFNNREYADLLDNDTALVFVRSEKDKAEQPLPDQTKKNGEPGYLRSYTGKDLNTADEMGYMAYGPTINFDFSGMSIKSASELRATWPEMSDEDKLKAAKLMYGNGAEAAVQLLNQALGDPEAPVGEAIDQRKAEEIVKNAIQHLLNRVDDKKITPTQAHQQLDDDLDGMIEDGYNLASDPKFRDISHKMLEEYMQRMMARDESVSEILGFATKNQKKTTIKKKRPPEEDSVKDKLAKRRAMAAKGDPNAYKTGAVEEGSPIDDLKKVIGSKVYKKEYLMALKMMKQEAISAADAARRFMHVDARTLDSMAEKMGVTEGKQRTGSAGQAKGKDPMPKAKPGRTAHPLKDKLVGEANYGRYWCSTDKKWKQRKGPKQSRKS